MPHPPKKPPVGKEGGPAAGGATQAKGLKEHEVAEHLKKQERLEAKELCAEAVEAAKNMFPEPEKTKTGGADSANIREGDLGKDAVLKEVEALTAAMRTSNQGLTEATSQPAHENAKLRGKPRASRSAPPPPAKGKHMEDDEICDVGDRMFESNLLREKGNQVCGRVCVCVLVYTHNTHTHTHTHTHTGVPAGPEMPAHAAAQAAPGGGARPLLARAQDGRQQRCGAHKPRRRGHGPGRP